MNNASLPTVQFLLCTYDYIAEEEEVSKFTKIANRLNYETVLDKIALKI